MDQPKFMNNPKSSRWYKADLQLQVSALQTYIQEMNKEKYDDYADATDREETRIDQWYGVAYIGWGSHEDDMYFVEAPTPTKAIELFEQAIKEGWFEGHGAHNKEERSMWPSTDERILVYEITECGEYRKTRWEKV